ncbi:MAG: acetolactate synthase small subunit [archaeon]
MRHIISMLVENQPGVLTRIAGMFARRGFNIETITVGKTGNPSISKMVVTVLGDAHMLEQIEKQINKLVDTVKVQELKPEASIERELCLLKIAIPDNKSKQDILKYADIYKTKVVDIDKKSVTVQIVGESDKIDSFIELVRSYGIKDISRTGVTAIARSNG